ncbi:MAG TPA: OpgC domain-containing protein [Chloroflexota bacterium]
MAVRTAARELTRQGQLWADIKARASSLAYADTGKRDKRLDLLRGMAVSAMVVDHVGGDTFMTALSGGNRSIVSAAEAFVFLSGLVLGMVYAEKIRKLGPAEAVKGMLHRALTLYKSSVGIAVAFIGLFVLTDLRLWVDRSSGLGTTDILQALVGALTLHYSFHGSDVMVMYTLMLAAAPGIIYLFYRGKTPMVLLASVALWAIFQRYPSEAMVPWSIENSAFPTAAWQLLFVLGMAAGYNRERLTSIVTANPGSTILAMLGSGSVLYLLSRANHAFGTVELPSQWFGTATVASLFDKPDLGPARVLAFLSLAVLVYTVVHSFWSPISALAGWFLLPLGQSSLYVYITHLFVIVAVYNLAPTAFYWSTVDNLNTGAQLLALAALWVMVRNRFLFRIVPR